MECCWAWELFQNKIQLLFSFKGFTSNSQLYSLARGREGKHSFFSPTGSRELSCVHYSCTPIFWDQEKIIVQHQETLMCLCSCDQSCKALSPLLWSCWLQAPTMRNLICCRKCECPRTVFLHWSDCPRRGHTFPHCLWCKSMADWLTLMI